MLNFSYLVMFSELSIMVKVPCFYLFPIRRSLLEKKLPHPLRPKTTLHEPIGLSNVSNYSGYRTEYNSENRIALPHIVSEYYAFEVSTMLQLAPSIQNIENVITSPISVRSSKCFRHRTQLVLSNIYSKFEADRT